MPNMRNPMIDPPKGPGDSARMVWLKMLGLLAGIAVFGLLIFAISRAVRLNF